MLQDTLTLTKDTILTQVPKDSILIVRSSDSLSDSTITGVISGILVTLIFIAYTRTFKDFEHCIVKGKFISGETFEIMGR